jgi:hypothetical protein
VIRRRLRLARETIRVLDFGAVRVRGGLQAESTGVPCISYFCAPSEAATCFPSGIHTCAVMCIPF